MSALEESMHPLAGYFQDVAQLLTRAADDPLPAVIDALERVRTDGRCVFIFGNGGSAATASHFACDLGKGTIQEGRPRFKVLSLSDSFSTFTAYANDMGYESVFSEPLFSLGQRGDLAVAFSGSGNSPNVLRAMDVARTRGLFTVGFTGFSGGKLKDCVDLHVNVPCDRMPQIEDVHLAMAHAICEMLKIAHD